MSTRVESIVEHLPPGCERWWICDPVNCRTRNVGWKHRTMVRFTTTTEWIEVPS